MTKLRKKPLWDGGEQGRQGLLNFNGESVDLWLRLNDKVFKEKFATETIGRWWYFEGDERVVEASEKN